MNIEKELQISLTTLFVGSDQIWNPKFIECLEDIESSTAYFAQTEKNCVCSKFWN